MHRLLPALLLALPCSALAEVPESPAAVKAVRVFEELSFDRPIVVTHDGVHADRIYVAEQKGRIVSFEKKPGVDTTAGRSGSPGSSCIASATP